MNDADLREIIDADVRERDRQFLKAWKVAVRAIGPELFNATLASVEAATECNDLCPNMEVIEQYVSTHDKELHYFLFMVISFFSYLKIEEVFMRAGIEFPRVIDLQLLTDAERMIIYSLVEYSDIEWPEKC